MAFPAVGSSTPAQRQLQIRIPRAKCPNGDVTSRKDGEEETLRRLRLGLKAAALVQLIEAVDAIPAAAIDRNWKPRRHHRRFGEGSTSRPILDTYKQPKLKKKKERTMAATTKSPRLKELRLESDRPKVVAVQASSRTTWTPPLMTSSLPSTALVMALLYAVAYFITRPRWWRWGRNSNVWESNRGRWVHDRALGGKEVFIATHAMDWNPLGSDQGWVDVSKNDATDDAVLPSWWMASLSIYVEPSQKSEARSKVQGIIRRLDYLRLSGEDYSFDLIIELYRICKDACIVAKVSRDNISNSVFRFAVKRTAMLVAEGIGLMYNLEPISFLCGLSEMLSVATQTAVSIIYRETAVKLRSLLLQVFVDVRSEDKDGSCGHAEKGMMRLLNTFPFPASEAELIGASITSTTSEQERILVYDRICISGPSFKHIIGKLLGKLELQNFED